MILDIKDITGALSKVSELTAGDKNIPGIMLNMTEECCAVRYSDGHKAFEEKLSVVNEEGDIFTKVVVPFEPFSKTIGNLQPSGSIVVNSLSFKFDTNVLKISADIGVNQEDTEGQTCFIKKSTKVTDIPVDYVENTTKQTVKLLDRMNYDSIFEPETDPDEWTREELCNLLAITSAEKGRSVYISPKLQKAYVVNTAYTTVLNVSKKFEPTEEDILELRGELEERGAMDKFEEEKTKLGQRVHYSLCIGTDIAKKIAGILNKLPKHCEKVYVYSKDTYMAVFTGDNKVGIFTEMARPSKMHIGSFSNFTSFEYTRFQMTFLREFLADSIKSAVNMTKNEKTTFTFKNSETRPGGVDLIIVSSNSAASVSDTYSIELDDLVDISKSLVGTSLTISLKTFASMLDSLKSEVVAFDISNENNGQVYFRLAEINKEKNMVEWEKARIANNLPIQAVAGQPLEKTPDEIKASYRSNTLDTCQYSILQK